MVSVPSASSVITISATLMRAEVLLFSARKLVVFAKARAVGASFTSVTERLNVADTGELPGRLESLAETLTA